MSEAAPLCACACAACWQGAAGGARRSRPATLRCALTPAPSPVLPRRAGHDLTVTNYLLLALGAFQFPFAFWLSIRL